MDIIKRDDAYTNDMADWPYSPRLPGCPEPEPLPLDALPPVLRAHVESVAAATQTPADMAAMIALASVSAALRGRLEVSVDSRGWREPVHIYTAPILPPGSRKSPVYAHMTVPLIAWEAKERDRVEPAYRRARDRVDVASTALRNVITKAARRKATQGDVDAARCELKLAQADVPILPRLIASDATTEALVQLMAEQSGVIALLGPEGDALGIADGRYSDAARVDELLRAWSAEPVTVDRIGREPIHIPRTALTFGICLQPSILDDLRHARTFRGRGLFARVLWVMPESPVGYRLTGRDVPPLNSKAASRYGSMLESLLDAGGPTNKVPQLLPLTPAALDLLYEYEAEVESQMRDGEPLSGICDAAAKMHGQAVRLAALIEIAARADDKQPFYAEPIGAWAMNCGVRLMRALSTHARAVLDTAGMDQRTGDAAYLLRRLRKLPEGSTVRDVNRAVQGRKSIADADNLAELLDDLVQRGCILLRPVTREGAGRSPSPVVELHPDLSSHNSVNSVVIHGEVIL